MRGILRIQNYNTRYYCCNVGTKSRDVLGRCPGHRQGGGTHGPVPACSTVTGLDPRVNMGSRRDFSRLRYQRIASSSTKQLRGLNGVRMHAASQGVAVASSSAWVSLVQAFHADPVGLITSVVACLGSVALFILLIVAVPALLSMKRAMEEMEVLVRSLQDELPDALAAVRLSGLEIADAVEEVSGLGSDLTAGIRASARALVDAEGGIRQGVELASGALSAAGPAMRKSMPAAKVAAEQALQQRAKMSYSATTVQEMAHATKIASKRLRTALGAVRLAKTANDAMILPQQGRRSGYYPDENETESVP